MGVVQGVHGGPAAVFVAAFGGVQPLQQGALAPCLDFGGEPDQAEEGTGPADGPGTETCGGGEPTRAAGIPDGRPAVAAGGEVRGARVCGSHRAHRPEGDTTTGDVDELRAQQQVMPTVYPLNVLHPARSRPPA